MPEYKGLSISFEGDTTALSAALHGIASDAQRAQGNLVGINEALKGSPSNRVDLLKDKLGQTAEAVRHAQRRVDAFNEGMKKNRQLASQTSTELVKQRAAFDQVKGSAAKYQQTFAGAYQSNLDVINRCNEGIASNGAQLRDNVSQYRRNTSMIEANAKAISDSNARIAENAARRSSNNSQIARNSQAIRESNDELINLSLVHERLSANYSDNSARISENNRQIDREAKAIRSAKSSLDYYRQTGRLTAEQEAQLTRVADASAASIGRRVEENRRLSAENEQVSRQMENVGLSMDRTKSRITSLGDSTSRLHEDNGRLERSDAELTAAIAQHRAANDGLVSSNKKLEASSDRIGGKIAQQAAEARNAERANRRMDDSCLKLATKEKGLHDNVGKLTGRLKSLDTEYSNMQMEQDKNVSKLEMLKSKLVSANTAVQMATSNWGKMGTAMITGGDAISKLGGKLSGITRMVGRMEILGQLFNVPINPSGAIKAAEEFGNKMSQVGGYLDISGDKLDEMKGVALKWGKDTKYSAGEAADAISELAKGGLTEAQIKSGALRSAMLLASAGNLSMADAAEVAVQAIKVFGLEAADSSRVADALAGAANKSTAEIDSLAHGFKYVGGWANLAGWNINDVSGALALLSDHGLQGEMAGTALRNVMQRLAAPTDTAAKLMSDYGVEVRDANGNMKSATDVIDELNNKLGDLPSDEKDSVLNKIFGARALPAAVALMSEGSAGLQEYIDATKQAGYASEMAEAQLGKLGWAMEYLRGEAETAQVNIGSALEPTLIDLAHKVEDALDAFNGLSDAQRKSVVNMALMAVAAGPVLGVVGHIVSTLGRGVVAIKGFMSATKGLSMAGSVVKGLTGSFTALGMEEGAAVLKAGTLVSTLTATAGVAAAAAAVGLLGYAFWKSGERAREVEANTKRLDDVMKKTRGTIRTLNRSMREGGDTADGYAEATRVASKGSEELIDSIENHASAARENADAVAASNGLLEQYRQIIHDCAGKTELTKEESAKLAWALKGLADETGNAYTEEQILSGTYEDEEGNIHNVIDEIDKLIEARKREARMAALTEGYKDAYKDELEAGRAVADGTKRYYEEREKAIKHYMDTYKGATREQAEWYADSGQAPDVTEAKQNLEDLSATYDVAKQRAEGFANAIGEEQKVLSEGMGPMETFLHEHSDIERSLENAGISAHDLAYRVEELGGSKDTLQAVSDGFAGMAASCGGSMDLLSWMIMNYNSLPIDPKTGIVNVDDLQLVNALGEAVIWNGTEFVTKETGVHVDTGEVQVAAGEIETYNDAAGSMESPSSSATVDHSSVDSATKAIQSFGIEPFAPRNSTASTNYGTVVSANAAMRTNQNMAFNDRSNTITTTYVTKHVDQHAAGGFIPYHASGGYITKATLTKDGIVGENGVEYYDGHSIIPLTNRHYAQPFIDLLSDGLTEKLGGTGGTTYNFYVNDAVINDSPAIQGAFLNLFETLQREGAMNCG